MCMHFTGLVPDKEVRVSVKALAVSCVGAAAALLPETFFNRLYLEPLDGQQTNGKILKYSEYNYITATNYSEKFNYLYNLGP